MSVVDAPARRLDAEAEALFREARRRARRRRLRRLAVAVAIVASGALVYGVGFASSTRPARPSRAGPFADRAAFAGHGRLAFVSQGRLWLLDGTRLDAVSRPGQQTAHPQFSPGGRWLSYTTATGEEWIARADGSGARPLAAAPANQTWLPDGRLVAGGSIWRIAPNGRPIRIAAEPDGLVAWAPDGSRYVFFGSAGRLEAANSLRGPRTTWLRTSTPANELLDAAVLPHREGILFQLDPGGSADLPMDGLYLNDLRAPGASPIQLGPTVGIPIVASAAGTFAVTLGPNRYAWSTRTVEVCRGEHCRAIAVGELSFDPAFSPDGRTLAFVQAPASSAGDFRQSTLVRWSATHTLWLWRAGRLREVPHSAGASVPVWSADGRSLLFESRDGLWLLPTLSGTPVRIAGPLFPPQHWPGSWGQIDWAGQFAWSDS